MQPDAGANQQLAAEPKSRTSTKTGRQVNEVAGQDLRPRNGIRASGGHSGEGKAVTSERSRFGETQRLRRVWKR